MQLSPNWFQQFPSVDSDSLDFRAAVSYWMKNIGATKYEIIKDSFNGMPQGPDEINFTLSDGRTVVIEARTAAFSPERALIDLYMQSGIRGTTPPPFVRPSAVVLKPPLPPPPPNPVNPIGPPLENADAPGWFHSLRADHRPEGTIWPDPYKPNEAEAAQGHSYYKQSTIMYGPLWYQLS